MERRWLTVPYLIRRGLVGALHAERRTNGATGAARKQSLESLVAGRVVLSREGPVDPLRVMALGRIVTLRASDLDAVGVDPVASGMALQSLTHRIVRDGEQCTFANDAAMYLLLAQSIERTLRRFPTSLRPLLSLTLTSHAPPTSHPSYLLLISSKSTPAPSLLLLLLLLGEQRWSAARSH